MVQERKNGVYTLHLQEKDKMCSLLSYNTTRDNNY